MVERWTEAVSTPDGYTISTEQPIREYISRLEARIEELSSVFEIERNHLSEKLVRAENEAKAARQKQPEPEKRTSTPPPPPVETDCVASQTDAIVVHQDTLDERISEKDTELAALNADISRYQVEAASLHRDLDATKHALSAVKEDNTRLTRQVEDLEQDKRRAAAIAGGHDTARRELLEEKLLTMEVEVRTARRLNDTLLAKIRQLETRLDKERAGERSSYLFSPTL